MEYLPLNVIRERSEAVNSALDSLLTTRALTFRREARQWRFLSDSLQRLLSPGFVSDFDCLSPVTAAQYKFEIEDRLRRFYLHPGNSVDYVFSIVHRSKLLEYHDADFETYPYLAGYCLLVRDLSVDRKSGEIDGENLRLYLERVVVEANDAEFRAYAALPEVSSEGLGRWFCAGSPAMNEIINLLTRHREKKWIISNPFNPSTKRVLDIKVKKVGQHEARVNTMEYWYLRWWDERDGSYAFSYRETNRQMYVLRNENGEWRVFQNLRTLPRTSTPNRWNRRQK